MKYNISCNPVRGQIFNFFRHFDYDEGKCLGVASLREFHEGNQRPGALHCGRFTGGEYPEDPLLRSLLLSFQKCRQYAQAHREDGQGAIFPETLVAHQVKGSSPLNLSGKAFRIGLRWIPCKYAQLVESQGMPSRGDDIRTA